MWILINGLKCGKLLVWSFRFCRTLIKLNIHYLILKWWLKKKNHTTDCWLGALVVIYRSIIIKLLHMWSEAFGSDWKNDFTDKQPGWYSSAGWQGSLWEDLKSLLYIERKPAKFEYTLKMPLGCLPLQVFWGRPSGTRTRGRCNSLMGWECLGISREDRGEVA